jgi:hypothetical protein
VPTRTRYGVAAIAFQCGKILEFAAKVEQLEFRCSSAMGEQVALLCKLGWSFGEEWSLKFLDLFQVKVKSTPFIVQFFNFAEMYKWWDSQKPLNTFRTKISDPFIANALYGRDVYEQFTIDKENSVTLIRCLNKYRLVTLSEALIQRLRSSAPAAELADLEKMLEGRRDEIPKSLVIRTHPSR